MTEYPEHPQQALIVQSVRGEMREILEAIDQQREELAEKLGQQSRSPNGQKSHTEDVQTAVVYSAGMGGRSML
jgi:hypothetical protein